MAVLFGGPTGGIAQDMRFRYDVSRATEYVNTIAVGPSPGTIFPRTAPQYFLSGGALFNDGLEESGAFETDDAFLYFTATRLPYELRIDENTVTEAYLIENHRYQLVGWDSEDPALTTRRIPTNSVLFTGTHGLQNDKVSRFGFNPDNNVLTGNALKLGQVTRVFPGGTSYDPPPPLQFYASATSAELITVLFPHAVECSGANLWYTDTGLVRHPILMGTGTTLLAANLICYGDPAGSGNISQSTTLVYSTTGNLLIGTGTNDPAARVVVNGTSASAPSAVVEFQVDNSSKAWVGAETQNGTVITGAVVGDLSIRSDSMRTLFSTDGGATCCMNLADSKVGINLGATTASAFLHVHTTAAGTTAASNVIARLSSSTTARDATLQFSDTATNSAHISMLSGNLHFSTMSKTSAVQILGTSGLTGINTVPSYQLHVSTTLLTGTTVASNIVARFQSADTGRDASIQLSDNVTYAGYLSMLSGDLHLSPDGATSALVAKATTGRVGIGLTGPQSPLEVLANGTGIISRSSTATGYTAYVFLNDQNSSSRSLNLAYTGSNTSAPFITNAPTGSAAIREAGFVYTTGARHLVFGISNSAVHYLDGATGHMLWTVDNSFDIGAAGATRPRAVYSGGLISAGTNLNSAVHTESTSASPASISGTSTGWATVSPNPSFTAYSNDHGGRFTITAAAGLSANPTVTVNYTAAFNKGAWPVVIAYGDHGGTYYALDLVNFTTTASSFTFTYLGTPVASDVYTFLYNVEGTS